MNIITMGVDMGRALVDCSVASQSTRYGLMVHAAHSRYQ
jgi:hypothetical protein